MKTLKIILILFFAVILSYCSTNEMDNSPRGIFTIHDSAVDSLSVLQVELTELKIADLSGNETIVFTEAENETFVLNLLTLDGISNLIGSVPLEPATYKEVTLSFKNAVAVDKFGNILPVVPKNYYTIKILLNPNVLVETENVFFDIDFDVNNSIYSVTTGKNGKVELHPVLIIKIDPQFSGAEDGDDEDENEIDELKGVIESIDKMSMVVSFNGSSINVTFTENTIIEVDEFITTPPGIDNDITSVLFVGDNVEVDGPLDPGTNTVIATKVERKWGDPKGIEFQGVVFGMSTSSFDVLVMNSGDSTFTPGIVQTVNFNMNTLFLYTDPAAVTKSGYLEIGQDVKITGEQSGLFTATRVKLRETKLKGIAAGPGPSANQFYIKADTVEKMSSSNIPGFTNPVLVELKNPGNDPLIIAEGSKFEVEGQFNRASMGVYLASEWEAEEEEEEEVEIESKDFSIFSNSPLKISATGVFKGLGFTTSTTIQILVEGSTSITKNEKGNKTSMTMQELIDGINDGLFESLEAEGWFDDTTNILTAKKVKVEVAEAEEESN